MSSLLNKHDNDETKKSVKKSENNLQPARPGKPQEIFTGFKKRPKKQYATLRTDKSVICELKALRNFYGDHNVGITLERMLKEQLPKVLTDDKKEIFFDGLVNSYEKSIGGKAKWRL